MSKYYTIERNTQMLISLLKAHQIKKIVVSPGMKNMCFVGSIQQDDFFEIYSCVDERSAAYMACGMAVESHEPVVLSCTGATASRNYLPALTEAFYRKIPVLAVTSMSHIGEVGQLIPQIIDRSTLPRDTAKLSVHIPMINCADDEWSDNVLLNQALLELRHRGGGPVHINLITKCSIDFTVKELPPTRVIKRITCNDNFPNLERGRVAIYVGSHNVWSSHLTELVDQFCEIYDAVVLCDQTSNYKGKYKIYPSLLCSQKQYSTPCKEISTLIHIGEISGASMTVHPKNVWRVNPDGEIRDTFKKLEYVFEMEEENFFSKYVEGSASEYSTGYYQKWLEEVKMINSKIPPIPFSNVWIAQQSIQLIPKNSVLHLGILNTLRCWNYFAARDDIASYANTGGFGIDGPTSTLLGAALTNPETLYFGAMGDLAFFYDLNVLGNRHIPANLRVLLINNGRGTEFRNYGHKSARFGEAADPYMAAAGHYGSQSRDLVCHYASDLGFEYLCAANKQEYTENSSYFFTAERTARPMIFEIFTDSTDESKAIELMRNIESTVMGKTANTLKDILGDKVLQKISDKKG